MGTPIAQNFTVPTGIMPRGGKAFYVHEVNGSGDNEGTDPQFPLQYIGEAYAKVTDAGGDYVFCQYMSTLQETLTITYNDIHFIALGHAGYDTGCDLNGGSSVSVVFGSGGYDIELAGFNIGNDGSDNAIEATAGAMYRNHIHHNNFGPCFGCDWGINATSVSHNTIDNNVFAYALDNGGISLSDATSNMIANNVFLLNTDGNKGIYFPIAAHWNMIMGNVFGAYFDNDEPTGWAIHLVSGCTKNIIAWNAASECGGGDGNDAYEDGSSTGVEAMTNAWMANVKGDDWDAPRDSS